MSRYDKDGLTLRERDVYNYIIQFKTINSIAPTISEISQGLYSSRTFIRRCVHNLENKGFIRYDETKRRSIIVIKLPHKIA